jgi:hypothetical protein
MQRAISDLLQPVLLIALDEYYKNPTENCVKEIYDTLNSLDLSLVPSLTRHEKLVMRNSERTDVFAEKFARRSSREISADIVPLSLGLLDSSASSSSKLNGSFEVIPEPLSRSKSATSLKQHKRSNSGASAGHVSDASHNSSGSGLLMGEDSHQDNLGDIGSGSVAAMEALKSREDLLASSSDSGHIAKRRLPNRDTHFYETSIKYANIPLPIKIPVSAFLEEVGDVSIIIIFFQIR